MPVETVSVARGHHLSTVSERRSKPSFGMQQPLNPALVMWVIHRPTIQVDINSTCNGMALSLPTREQSTGKDDPQAPGWTKSNEQNQQHQFLGSQDHIAGSSEPEDTATMERTSVIQASLHGRADSTSMAGEGFDDEPEVQSRLTAVEEVGTYDPENRICTGGDNRSDSSSYRESTTRGAE
ncbi:uncharacterized protein [Triticum aestivum]|uniref:uncharacterized protein isoform X1 n=1 Tax=Triticum aestivum TaxID=4565 RepID=UPI001D032139|nr:uncharacterized protein LOC123125890 isoform X1 [Triticum aestivum]